MRSRRALVAAVVTLLAVWLVPWHALAPGGFSAHMVRHVGVVAVAAPLLALAIAGGRFDPVRRAPALFPPVLLSFVELVVVWAWHAPALHHAARGSAVVQAVEQASFLAAGLAVWIASFGGDPRDRDDRRAAGAIALLLTFMHMTLLGALLALSPRTLYGDAHHGLGDQHLGGAFMLLGGSIAYLAGGVWLTLDLLRDRAGVRR